MQQEAGRKGEAGRYGTSLRGRCIGKEAEWSVTGFTHFIWYTPTRNWATVVQPAASHYAVHEYKKRTSRPMKLRCRCNSEIKINLQQPTGLNDLLRAGRPRGWSSSPGWVKNFLFSTSYIPTLGSIQPAIQWVSGPLYPGVKRPGREAHHSPPSSAEVKKMWIYTPTSPYAFMA
jgi:hypothetical protein